MEAIDLQSYEQRHQLSKNLLSNFLYFALNVVIGIWMVPYLIKHVGISKYGLIPLAASLTGYIGLITLSLNGAVSRYLTIDLQKNNIETANKTFNTAFFGILGIIIALIPITVIFCIYIPEIFDVPPGHEQDATLLFIGVMATFLITTLSANFGVSFFAKNRLDLRNLIDTSNLLTRIALLLLLFTTLSPNLEYVGLSYLCGALVTFLGSLWIWKKLTPQLKIDLHSFDRSRLGHLISMSGWLIITQVGALLFLNIDLIIVNKLFGSVAGGEYASVLQWSALLRSMAGIIPGALVPIVLIHYANENREQIINLSKRAVKFMGFGMALPIGLICGFASPLLSLWIGHEFAGLSPLLCLLTGHLIVNLSVLPLFSINMTLNKVRIPAMVTLYMGLGNLLLALLFPIVFGWGVYGIAAAGAIVLTLKNAIFTPWYCAKILNLPKNTFTKSIIPGVVSFVFISITAYTISSYINLDRWIYMLSYGGLIGLVYIVTVWFIGLNRDERKIILSFIPSKMSNGSDYIGGKHV